MTIAISTAKLSAKDIWLASILVAAINMLWLSGGVAYSVRDSFNADFLLSNWLILLAAVCALYFVRESRDQTSSKWDWAVFTATVLLAFWPIKHTSTLALSGISVYLFYHSRQQKHPDHFLLAAASVLFALSFSRLWSPLLLKIFATYFEQFDVFLLGNLLQTKTVGNTIDFLFEPGKKAIIVMGCTSFANLSAVVLLWLVVLRLIHIQPRWRIELKTGLWLLAVAIGINTLRIALMITTNDMYELVHGSIGSSVTAFLLTICSVVFGIWGAKRVK